MWEHGYIPIPLEAFDVLPYLSAENGVALMDALACYAADKKCPELNREAEIAFAALRLKMDHLLDLLED